MKICKFSFLAEIKKKKTRKKKSCNFLKLPPYDKIKFQIQYFIKCKTN